MSEFVEGVEQTFEVEAVTSTLAPGYRAAVPPAEYARRLAEQRDRDDRLSRARASDDLVRQLQAVQAGTGGYREDGIELWAHCGNVNAGCDDTQERVMGARISQARTYRDGGDDSPAADRVERSWTEYDWSRPEDASCKRCGERRQLGEQRRPTYENQNGFDQRALLKMARAWTKGGAAQLGDGVVVQTAQPATAQTPLDALGFRLANGQIQIEEFRELRAVLEGAAPIVAQESESEPSKLPEGIRRRGDRYQARLNKSETPEGEGERIIGTFATVDEAVSARAEALTNAA